MDRVLWLAPASLLLLMGPGLARAQRLAPSAKAVATPFDDLSDWNAFNQKGWQAINHGWHDTAERQFQAAIKVARRPTMNRPHLLVRSYADLAWALQLQGRNAEAEPLARWALESREKLHAANSIPVAQSLNQLATLYSDLGRYAEAEALLRKALGSQDKDEKLSGQEHARTRTLLGLLMVGQRQYAEAEAEFAAVVKIRERSLGATHPETGDAMSNLAFAKLETGGDVEARSLFDRCLALFERARGPSDVSVARALEGLARIDAKQGDLNLAAERYQRAVEIREAQPPPTDPAQRSTLLQYADVLDRLGREAEGRRVRARAGPAEGVGGPASSFGKPRNLVPEAVPPRPAARG